MQKSSVSPQLFLDGLFFAGKAHGDQKVPGRDISYMCHVAGVVGVVMIAIIHEPVEKPDLAIGCATRHDVGEDTMKTITNIRQRDGDDIANGTAALTKDESFYIHFKKGTNEYRAGKRAAMEDSLFRILLQPHEIGLVKMADRFVNLSAKPPAHWTLQKYRDYADEGELIWQHLKHCHSYMASLLEQAINEFRLKYC